MDAYELSEVMKYIEEEDAKFFVILMIGQDSRRNRNYRSTLITRNTRSNQNHLIIQVSFY